MSGADTVGKQIAAANTAPEPNVVAGIIFAALFETGPKRLNSTDAYLAKTAIRAAITEYRNQLLAGKAREIAAWKDPYVEVKRELDELKMKITMWQKDGKI